MGHDQRTVNRVPLVILDGPSIVLPTLISSHLFAMITVDTICDIAVLNDTAIAEILCLSLKDSSLEPIAAVPRVDHVVNGVDKVLSAPLMIFTSVFPCWRDLGRPAIDGKVVLGRRV